MEFYYILLSKILVGLQHGITVVIGFPEKRSNEYTFIYFLMLDNQPLAIGLYNIPTPPIVLFLEFFPGCCGDKCPLIIQIQIFNSSIIMVDSMYHIIVSNYIDITFFVSSDQFRRFTVIFKCSYIILLLEFVLSCDNMVCLVLLTF